MHINVNFTSKVSLTELMSTLHNCEPHFVRCLVPNTHKKPGEVHRSSLFFVIFLNVLFTMLTITMLITTTTRWSLP